eukprot:Skav204146  [mRNA]  locus=scaffold903:102043:102420:+ [translate_table: standard]
MRTKIIEACQRKLSGNLKKTRFGGVEMYDPVLTTRPSGKNPWKDLGDLEKSQDKDTYRAAFRTWRFCATGVDGLEEDELIRDSFESWRQLPPEESIFTKIFNDLVESVGAFFGSMPCCGDRRSGL